MRKPLIKQAKIYKLPLADGTVWGLSATSAISPWLDELASIMQLKVAAETAIDRKVFFLALKSDNQQPSSSQNWEALKQGGIYRIWSHSTIPETFIELNREFIEHPEIKIINMWSALKTIYRYYVAHNAGPVHAALAKLGNKGILIAAAGGTGKSTCSVRFPAPWRALADDNALIVKNHSEERYYAHPMPTWSDHLWSEKFSTTHTSQAVPLKAIFFLQQSNRDAVTPLPNAVASQKLFSCFKQIWENYMTKLDQASKVKMGHNMFNNASEIIKQVPGYTLEATLNGQFWHAIEQVL